MPPPPNSPSDGWLLVELGAGEVSWFRLGVGDDSFIRLAPPGAELRSSGNVPLDRCSCPSDGVRDGDLSGEIAGTDVVPAVVPDCGG